MNRSGAPTGTEMVPALSRRQFMAAAVIAAAMQKQSTYAGTPSVARGIAGASIAMLQDDEKPVDLETLGITAETIAQAEKIACVEFTKSERAQILKTLGGMLKRQRTRQGLDLPFSLAPATVFTPMLPGVTAPLGDDEVALAVTEEAPLPDRDEDIAFAPAKQLSQWLHSGAITSRRLTELYLERLARFGPQLECVVTLTDTLALEQAERADAELAAGRSRGPLHGIPWGAKDLFDTANIRTTWGAAPYRERVAERNAAVVDRLEAAGAVLVAKLTLGAMAYGDIWFGGRTNNPWNIEEGSSGSSAGSAASTAAGLVGFSLGTETYGSIVSPCMTCGATGLRPTFGRVARTGAMPLCWTLDKVGPICRTVEDCALVFAAIHGSDPGDPSSYDARFAYHGDDPLRRLRIGRDPAWFEDKPATDIDRRVLELVRTMNQGIVNVELPKWPYEVLETILVSEAASAFDTLTVSNDDDQLTWQDDDAWPNTFRMARLVPAVELVQADRFRRRVCEMMNDLFEDVDVLVAPSFASSLLLITNFTGHPSLTLRCGFDDKGMPQGITLIGKLLGEGTLCRLGHELEEQLHVWDKRPTLA